MDELPPELGVDAAVAIIAAVDGGRRDVVVGVSSRRRRPSPSRSRRRRLLWRVPDRHYGAAIAFCVLFPLATRLSRLGEDSRGCVGSTPTTCGGERRRRGSGRRRDSARRSRCWRRSRRRAVSSSHHDFIEKRALRPAVRSGVDVRPRRARAGELELRLRLRLRRLRALLVGRMRPLRLRLRLQRQRPLLERQCGSCGSDSDCTKGAARTATAAPAAPTPTATATGAARTAAAARAAPTATAASGAARTAAAARAAPTGTATAAAAPTAAARTRTDGRARGVRSGSRYTHIVAVNSLRDAAIRGDYRPSVFRWTARKPAPDAARLPPHPAQSLLVTPAGGIPKWGCGHLWDGWRWWRSPAWRQRAPAICPTRCTPTRPRR